MALSLQIKSNLTKDKMKTEGNKWSSVDEVLDSFNNVSIMPTIQSEDSDIFSNPSPPKHCISPSQLELLEEIMGYRRSPSPENQPTISRGRGRIIRKFENVTPKARDATLMSCIRANKVTYSNASIEDYVNSSYYSSSDGYAVKNDSISEKSEESESCSDIKSPDQISINSTLRPEAEDFYPCGMAHDPVELSDRLLRLKPSSKVNKENKYPSFFTRSSKRPLKPLRKEPCIGFNIASDNDDDNDDDNDASESTTDEKNINSVKTLLSSSSSSTTALSFNQENKKSIENKRDTKVPRSKRVMKNALLSSLTLSKQMGPHLMKPNDFEQSSTSFKPSCSSAFHPIGSSNSNFSHTSLPYDFHSDPSIDPQTKELISALTSESSDLSMPFTMNSDSLTSSPFFGSPKPHSSSYSCIFNEKDFPPLS